MSLLVPASVMTGEVPAEVAVVLGTRSEAVALAPVVRALRRCGRFSPLVVSTGQQRGGLDQVLRPLGVRPDVDLALAVRDAGGSSRRLAAEAVERLGELLAARRPTAVLVHGGSATAFGAALAARTEGIGVGHLGAGVRQRQPGVSAPQAEDANQRLIAPLTRWHLAPTSEAAANLLAEGIDPAAVTVTGTTGVDALLWAASLQRGTSAFEAGGVSGETGGPAGRRSGGRVLACLRLREGDGERLAGLTVALRRLAADGTDVVVPLHPDGVPEPLLAALGGEGVRLVPPLDYLDFVTTMRRATLVVTDSPAVEEEAPALGKPVLVLGDGAGGRDPDALVRRCRRLIDDPEGCGRAEGARGPDPLADGHAAERVLDVLIRAVSGLDLALAAGPVTGWQLDPTRLLGRDVAARRAPQPV